MENCKCGKQVQIGQNGEVVTISLSEYEDLIECKKALWDILNSSEEDDEENNK